VRRDGLPAQAHALLGAQSGPSAGFFGPCVRTLARARGRAAGEVLRAIRRDAALDALGAHLQGLLADTALHEPAREVFVATLARLLPVDPLAEAHQPAWLAGLLAEAGNTERARLESIDLF
jgi:hypothetical protein